MGLRASATEARAIAKDATVYGFRLIDGYRIQYSYFLDRTSPEFKGAWNEVHNTARVFTSDDKAIQTPNSDTPYSFLGADLRTEPLACRPSSGAVTTPCCTRSVRLYRPRPEILTGTWKFPEPQLLS
jgi:hypothetical protein